MQNRILIVITDGSVSGVSATDDSGSPQPLNGADLSSAVAEINAAALVAVESLTAERDALASLRDDMTTKVITALQSGDPEQYAALGREFITPEIDKKRAELAAKKAEIEAEIAALPQ